MAGIYIHIPFCKQACHYCDFHFSTSLSKKDPMLSAMATELELRSKELANTSVETIYFGGGTPSILEKKALAYLIREIHNNFDVIDVPEITLEANPDDLSKAYIESLKDAGINRLSIGVQSFFDDDLRLMNRAHDANMAETCIIEAKNIFDNISIDLIYGIPNSTSNRWLQNIEKTLSFDLPHISSYALTVEPKTALKSFIEKGIVPAINEEDTQAQYYQLLECLEHKGYINYETSNFGLPGHFSQNNSAYWSGKTYLGIGPSAHSYNGTRRSWNVRNNSKYIRALREKKLPMKEEILSKEDIYNEYIMMGLRTMWGVSLEKVRLDFGQAYSSYLLKQTEKYLKNHSLFVEDDIIYATKEGKFLIDGIASDLFMIK